MKHLKKEGFNKLNILVIGDCGIDKFSYGSAVRLAPEAPVPVFNPIYETMNSGMAGNVVENLKSLGINTHFISNINPIIKTRYVDERSGQILLRVDENDKTEKIKNEILFSIKNNSINDLWFDAIIISDYDKGFLEEEDIEYLCKNNKNVFIDTKKILGKWCIDATFIKINHVEYIHTEYSIKELNIFEKLIITLSSKGCMHKNKLYKVQKVKIKDVSGAGDTFLSGLVAEYVLSKNIEEAIIFAQECATVVVQKPGVSTI